MDFLDNQLKDSYRWRDLPKLPASFEEVLQAHPVKSYTPHPMVRPKLKVGIEVEVERVREHYRQVRMPMAHVWDVKEDGSLRHGGLEFVSFPLHDQFIPYAIQYMFNDYLPPIADFSERTSIHVHVNVRNWTCGDVLNLLLLYIVFEKILYQFAGPDRYKNIFCVPVQETKLPVALSNYLAVGDFVQLLSSWAKYSGLNLLPIRNFGTVEYRHMKGHRDAAYLLNWINILQQLHRYAETTKFSVLFNTIKTLNSTSYYEEFLRTVFGKYAHMLMPKNLQTSMEYGVSVVKAIQPPSPFLKKLLSEISNNSALLKSLQISEKQTKKAEFNIPPPDEFRADDWEAFAVQAAAQNNAVNAVINEMRFARVQPQQWANNAVEVAAQEDRAPRPPVDMGGDVRMVFDSAVRGAGGLVVRVGAMYVREDGVQVVVGP